MTGKGVLVYGEALVDIVPGSAGRKREAVLGGSGFNTALALARCGAPVAFNVSLSQDTLGQYFLRRLTEEGIDRRFVEVCDAPTPSATVTSIDAEGAATYRFSLNGTAFDIAPPMPTDLDGFAHLHVTSFGATIGASGEAALALMRRAREAGLSVSYDLNIRPAVLPALAEARRAIEERAILCDLLKCSNDDARAVHGAEFGYAFARWFAQEADCCWSPMARKAATSCPSAASRCRSLPSRRRSSTRLAPATVSWAPSSLRSGGMAVSVRCCATCRTNSAPPLLASPPWWRPKPAPSEVATRRGSTRLQPTTD